MYQTGVYIVVSSSKLLLFHSPRTALIYSLKKIMFFLFCFSPSTVWKKSCFSSFTPPYMPNWSVAPCRQKIWTADGWSFCARSVAEITILDKSRVTDITQRWEDKKYFKSIDPNLSLHCTRVKIDPGLPYDQLGGYGGLGVASVEKLGNLQQTAWIISPVEVTVH